MPYRRILFLAFSLILLQAWCNTANAQTVELQKISNIDTTRLTHLISQADSMINRSPDSARKISIYIFNQSRASGFGNGIRKSLINLIKLDYKQNRFEQVLSNTRVLLNYSPVNTREETIPFAHYYAGLAHERLAHYQQSFNAFSKAVSASSDSFTLLAGIYNNMGMVLYQLFEFRKAVNFFDKSVTVGYKTRRYDAVSMGYANKAISLAELKAYAESEQCYDSAISVASRHKLYKNLIGALCFKADFYNKIQQYNKAISTTLEAERIYKEHKIDFDRIYLVHLFSGNAYFRSGRFKKAESEYLKAKSGISKYQGGGDQSYIFHQLSSLYFSTGRFKKAYLTHLESHQMLDSIKSKEVTANVNALETQYRTVEKDKEIALKTLKLAQKEKIIALKNNQILLVISAALFILTLGLWRYGYKQRKQKHEQEIAHLKGIIKGEEKERSRLAHDLHDGINSQLAAVQTFLFAGVTHHFLQEDKNFNTARNLLRDTAQQVRQIAHNLTPDNLLLKGLPLVVQEFCQQLFDGGPVKARTEIYGDYQSLDTSLALHLYRILQELVQNVHKHAKATELTVILFKNEEVLMMTVEDNGKGMDLNTNAAVKGGGIGLSGIRERVNLYKGETTLISKPGQGTSIHITIPQQPKEQMPYDFSEQWADNDISS